MCFTTVPFGLGDLGSRLKEISSSQKLLRWARILTMIAALARLYHRAYFAAHVLFLLPSVHLHCWEQACPLFIVYVVLVTLHSRDGARLSGLSPQCVQCMTFPGVWLRDGHMIQIEPMRGNKTFSGILGKKVLLFFS